jgi:hypothetical protein
MLPDKLHPSFTPIRDPGIYTNPLSSFFYKNVWPELSLFQHYLVPDIKPCSWT